MVSFVSLVSRTPLVLHFNNKQKKTKKKKKTKKLGKRSLCSLEVDFVDLESRFEYSRCEDTTPQNVLFGGRIVGPLHYFYPVEETKEKQEAKRQGVSPIRWLTNCQDSAATYYLAQSISWYSLDLS